MQYRQLGHTGFSVSEIGFGAWGIGGGWGPTNDEEALRAIRRALDLGINFFDSALGYGEGHSEALLGQALNSIRSQVFITSKIPPKTREWPVLPHEPIENTFPPEWIIECTEQSLKHLGSDYIDVQQLHAWTDSYTLRDEWHSAFETLKQQGKIRAYGVSANDWDPYGPTNLVRSGRIDSVQVIYNIFEQRPAEALLPAAQEHHVGIIVRVPFEEGLLTGAFGPGHQFPEGDWRGEWLTPDRLAEANRRVEALKPFLAEDRPTLAALALKFCLGHPAVSTVIPGMRQVRNVEANAAVSDGKPLNAATLEALKAHAFVHGWDYPWAQQPPAAS